MIVGINGAPYIDMSEYVDMDTLDKLFLPIAKGIAQLGQFTPATPAYFPPKTKNRAYKDMNDLTVCDDPELAVEYAEILSILSPVQKCKFAELTNGVVIPGTYIELRHSTNRSYNDIYESALCKDNIIIQQLFPLLMRFIRTLPFETIGRIIIFISYPYIEGQIHSDLLESKEYMFPPHENKDAWKDNHFIWFNPRNKKKFFMYDEEIDQKIPLMSRACFFNTWDYHGSDISTVPTFSFRVDGKFTEELKTKLNL